MKLVYHGSKTQDLNHIEPRVSTHMEKLVYATESPCIATIFANDGGSDFDYVLGGTGTNDNPFYLVERKAHGFDRIFQRPGSIYTLDSKNFKHSDGFWNAEVVAEGPQEVLNEEKIPNLLEKLKEFADDGILKLYRYPARPSFVPLDNSDLIDKSIYLYKKGHLNIIKSLLKYYPEFADEVNSRLNDNEKAKEK